MNSDSADDRQDRTFGAGAGQADEGAGSDRPGAAGPLGTETLSPDAVIIDRGAPGETGDSQDADPASGQYNSDVAATRPDPGDVNGNPCADPAGQYPDQAAGQDFGAAGGRHPGDAAATRPDSDPLTGGPLPDPAADPAGSAAQAPGSDVPAGSDLSAGSDAPAGSDLQGGSGLPDDAGVPAGAAPSGSPDLASATGAGPATAPGAADFHQQWGAIQSSFVDDPHGAVTAAAALATHAVSTLIAQMREQELSLRGSWENSGADTEVLRNALRSYRGFLDRLAAL
jgi:hypothetical protein